MQYRTLGSTGLNVSVVGVGTWQFGGEWGKTFEQDEVDKMFRRAKELGINLIDTAECYGDHTSEQFIGRALKNMGANRDDWVVATKFGHKFHGNFERTEPREPKDVAEQLEASLKALQLEYVDVLQYHSWGDDDFSDEDVLAKLLQLKEQGKVLHLGNSVGSNGNLKQVAVSRDMGLETIQIIYNRLDRTPEKQVFASCLEQKLGVLARVPLASGYLSGKYKPGHQFDKGEVRGRHGQEKSDEKLKEAQQIQEQEVPDGTDMASWALAWCLQHDAVSCVIPGCKNPEQVKSNAAAADLDLVKDDHPQAAKPPSL